jgi:hypothetical protein
MDLNLDLNGFGGESIICLIARQGNKIYKKKVLDKYYKLWKSFKNATRAKKFLKVLEVEKGIKLFEKSKNIYVSNSLI